MITKISDSNDCTFWDKSPERGFHNLLVNYHLTIWCFIYFWKKPLMLIIKTAFIWSNMEYIKVYIYFFSLLTSNGNVFCSVDVFWNRNVLKLFKYSSCTLRESEFSFFFLFFGMYYFTVTLFSLKKDIITKTKRQRGTKSYFLFFLFGSDTHIVLELPRSDISFMAVFLLTRVSHTITTI